MKSGKKRDGSRSSEPFNNPFADHSRQLKRAIRRSPDVLPSKPSETKESKAEPSESDVFHDAVGDVAPLSARRGGTARVIPTYSGSVGAALVGAPEDPAADEHFDIRFSDQFIRGRAEGVSNETVQKLEAGEFAVRSHVDLHGMPLDDARVVVDEFLAERQRSGDRCVLIITGKGRNSPRQVGVLREGIPQWLARGPSSRRVLAFVTARPCDGGEGALYVLLRRFASRKNRIDVERGGGV
jgi:DNA-nicking Smr family endonuclease